jgi:hypothetical protein
VRAGADAIKLMVTGGRLTPGSNPTMAQYSTQARQEIVRNCRVTRLAVERIAG